MGQVHSSSTTGATIQPGDVTQLFERFDTDGDGIVEYPEFIAQLLLCGLHHATACSWWKTICKQPKLNVAQCIEAAGQHARAFLWLGEALNARDARHARLRTCVGFQMQQAKVGIGPMLDAGRDRPAVSRLAGPVTINRAGDTVNIGELRQMPAFTSANIGDNVKFSRRSVGFLRLPTYAKGLAEEAMERRLSEFESKLKILKMGLHDALQQRLRSLPLDPWKPPPGDPEAQPRRKDILISFTAEEFDAFGFAEIRPDDYIKVADEEGGPIPEFLQVQRGPLSIVESDLPMNPAELSVLMATPPSPPPSPGRGRGYELDWKPLAACWKPERHRPGASMPLALAQKLTGSDPKLPAVGRIVAVSEDAFGADVSIRFGKTTVVIQNPALGYKLVETDAAAVADDLRRRFHAPDSNELHAATELNGADGWTFDATLSVAAEDGGADLGVRLELTPTRWMCTPRGTRLRLPDPDVSLRSEGQSPLSGVVTSISVAKNSGTSRVHLDVEGEEDNRTLQGMPASFGLRSVDVRSWPASSPHQVFDHWGCAEGTGFFTSSLEAASTDSPGREPIVVRFELPRAHVEGQRLMVVSADGKLQDTVVVHPPVYPHSPEDRPLVIPRSPPRPCELRPISSDSAPCVPSGAYELNAGEPPVPFGLVLEEDVDPRGWAWHMQDEDTAAEVPSKYSVAVIRQSLTKDEEEGSAVPTDGDGAVTNEEPANVGSPSRTVAEASSLTYEVASQVAGNLRLIGEHPTAGIRCTARLCVKPAAFSLVSCSLAGTGLVSAYLDDGIPHDREVVVSMKPQDIYGNTSGSLPFDFPDSMHVSMSNADARPLLEQELLENGDVRVTYSPRLQGEFIFSIAIGASVLFARKITIGHINDRPEDFVEESNTWEQHFEFKAGTGLVPAEGASDTSQASPVDFRLPAAPRSKPLKKALATTALSDGSGLATCRHQLTVQSVASSSKRYEVDLNQFNHCIQRFVQARSFKVAARSYCEHLVAENSQVYDAITGNYLTTTRQLLDIVLCTSTQGTRRPGYSDMPTIKALAEPLLEPSPHRHYGSYSTQPVLVLAPPGSGKTWSAIQLVHQLASQCARLARKPKAACVVPVLVYVQRLVRITATLPAGSELNERHLFEYLAYEFQNENDTGDSRASDWMTMLVQAYEMRSLIIVVDGIDEAAGRRDIISNFVHNTLVREGFRVVCTSRPEGVQVPSFTSRFVIFDLTPLSDAQQRRACAMQLQACSTETAVANVTNGPDTAEPAVTDGDDEEGSGLAARPAHNAVELCGHLLAFAKVRKRQDAIYRRVFAPDVRDAMEGYTAPNLLMHRRGDHIQPNPAMRLKAGGTFVAVSKGPGVLSNRVQALSTLLTAELTFKIDEILNEHEKRAKEEEASDDDGQPPESVVENVRAAAAIACGGGVPSKTELPLIDAAGAVAEKLVLLLQKRRGQLSGSIPTAPAMLEVIKQAAPQTTASDLWPHIMARTDQVYAANETLHPVFKTVLEELVAQLKLSAGALTFREELKDPVRLHEKAVDDHGLDFDDFDDEHVVPEACVLDVNAARILFPEEDGGARILRVLIMLERDFKVDVNGQEARLRLVSVQNKFDHLEATHFRHAILNLLLIHGGEEAVVEVQLHHESIYKYNEASHASSHYDFFCSMLSQSESLNPSLEQILRFFEDLQGVPVLLSLMTFIFKHQQLEALPTDRYKLYEMAIKLTLEGHDRAVSGALSSLASANHWAGRREFTNEDAARALTSPHELKAWKGLLQTHQGRVPLIKVLEKGDGVVTSSDTYQFKHLSFQEAMVAQRICASSHGKRDESQLMLESIAQLAAFICEPFNLNVCRIGAGALGDVLCKQLGKHKWDFSSHALSESGLDALVHLLDKNTTVTELNLQNQKLERGVITRFVNALASNPYALRTLKLGGNECRAEGARAIAKLLGGKNSTLTDLDVRDCNLGVAGGRLIGQALEDNTSLTSLNLSRNQLCGTLWNDPCIDPTSKACVIIDQVIAKRSLVATEHLEQRRFEIGALVECNMGSFRDGTSLYKSGVIEAVDVCLERSPFTQRIPRMSTKAKFPYQVKLIDESIALVPADADGYIRASEDISDDSVAVPKTRFKEYSLAGITAVTDALVINNTLTALDVSRNAVSPCMDLTIAQLLKPRQPLS